MKKLSPIAYRALFFKHLWRFLGNITTPSELSRGHAISVSGGLDSMTLLWVAQTLHKQGKIGPVRALFVHHHTRTEQQGDLVMIQKFCELEGIPFKALHISGLSSQDSNFEEKARVGRRDLTLKDLKKHERLWLGHHLDDSYEWALMQRNRSTNLKSTLGIPVRNHKIIRPFMCVTRSQIKKLGRFEGIPYHEDPTNRDTRFDRNYVRHEVVPKIRARFPKYLKHYSHVSNFAAMNMKISVLSRTGTAELFVFDDGAVLIGKIFSEVQLQEILHTYSSADRGEIISPIVRMLKAIENGKKGPFHYSGGMEAYSSYGMLMIYRQNLKNYDASIANVLSQLTDLQLSELPTYKRVELEHAWQNLLKTPDAMLNMPGLVLVLESDSVCKTLNTSVFDSLFPEVSAICKKRGLRFMSFQKCIELWWAKREKLPERLRLIPLNHLSNLFPSQQ